MIDVPSVVNELVGALVDNDDDDETDDAGLTQLFVKRSGTSSVKCNICGKCECSILNGKPSKIR
jgi:uncharacterized ferredoxin-like protein